MPNVARGFRDRDFIESSEGLLFAVVGNVHPRGRVVAYLKYAPGYLGGPRVKWSRGGIQYGRVLPYYSAMGVKHTIEFLRRYYPHYLVFDGFRGLELIEVPQEFVKVHYRPEERLAELLEEPNDPLEELAAELVDELSRESGVPPSQFGITGSILLRIHDPRHSDVDLVVYGVKASRRVREALRGLYERGDRRFARPTGALLEAWVQDIIRVHPLTPEEARTLYLRVKWNRGLYRGRQFSVHPVKVDEEVDEAWEDKVIRPVGLVKVRGTVASAEDSLYMPAVYKVEDVRVLEGASPPVEIRYVVSYEGLYIDIASEGDVIEVFGKAELVRDLRRGDEYAQVTVGTFEAQGRDYIKSPLLVGDRPLEVLKG